MLEKNKQTKTPPRNEDACLQDERRQEEDKKVVYNSSKQADKYRLVVKKNHKY